MSSATSPSVPRYMTNLCHDEVITKSAKKDEKAQILLKSHESDGLHLFLFVGLRNLCMQIMTNLPPKRQSATQGNSLRKFGPLSSALYLYFAPDVHRTCVYP